MQEFTKSEIEILIQVVSHEANNKYTWATDSIPRHGDKAAVKKEAEELFVLSEKLSEALKDGRIEIVKGG